jgi:hypothetical protein
MPMSLRPRLRLLAAAALLVAGPLASRPALAAHAAAPATASYCSVFPEPLTFSGGQPVACGVARHGDPSPAVAARAQGTVQRPASHLSERAACAQPGYGTMLLCPLWH